MKKVESLYQTDKTSTSDTFFCKFYSGIPSRHGIFDDLPVSVFIKKFLTQFFNKFLAIKFADLLLLK